MRLARRKCPAIHSALYQARICILTAAYKYADELMELLSCDREKVPQLAYIENSKKRYLILSNISKLKAPRARKQRVGLDI